MIPEVGLPRNYSFWRTVYSHGWCVLPPFEVRREDSIVRRVISLSNDRHILLHITQPGKKHLHLRTTNGTSLSPGETEEILSIVQSCLRFDEDLSEFYAHARKLPAHRWIYETRAGRLLRSPTVFEDVVKMICTTNCSWALTGVMVKNLCHKLGEQVDESFFSFPSPAAIADSSERYLRKEIRSGYRSPYILELARRVAKGQIDLESWRGTPTSTRDLFDEVRSIKGMGPYAAGNMLKLLGRYDYLGIDSWCRKRFCEIHRRGRSTTDKSIERHYEPYGKWRGLFFWLDVTKDWYDTEFPF